MSKRSSNLLRSNSYINMLRPYLNDSHKYATCPPVNLNQSHTHSNNSSLRAFNFNVNPLWRHNNPSQRKSNQLTDSHRRITSKRTKYYAPTNNNRAKEKSKKLSPTTIATVAKDENALQLQELPQCHNATLMLRSLPIFEVLPSVLMNSPDKHLLYQNSYLLDGISYEYDADAKRFKGDGKLKLDYMKFLKSISMKSKPSDRDIIFGNAKVLFAKTLGWEKSRIDWLLELERRQELRRRMHEGQPVDMDLDDKSIVNICCFPLFWHDMN